MTRNVKISADISKEAKKALDAYSVKHERSRSWLLNRMILKFCSAEAEEAKPSKTTEIKTKTEKPKRKVFTPPTVEEVAQYCNERCNNVDAQSFVDHYSGVGWMRGKNKIKDWKACVRTWEKNNQDKKAASSKKTQGNFSACEDFING